MVAQLYQVDGQTDTTELTAAFRKSANAMVPLDTVQLQSELHARTPGDVLKEDHRKICIRNEKQRLSS